MSEKVVLKAHARYGCRADKKANWEKINPILLAGEHGAVTDGSENEREKIGDGVTPWNELPWWRGPRGASGVYIGAGEMPEDCNLQIDPEGKTLDKTLNLSGYVEKRNVNNYINSNTLVIPRFEDIDNTEFKPLFKKCADTWINAYNNGKLVYKSLGVVTNNDGNISDGMKDSVNPMIYKTHNGIKEGMEGFTSEYREICNEARAKFNNGEKCHLNCISLCNMLVMGVTFERSRLFNPTNVIGSAGYGFDICKLLKNATITPKTVDDSEIGRLVTYNSNNTLDMINFTEILTQLKVHGKSPDIAAIENTAYGKFGLCKNVVASTETPNSDEIRITDIRAGDIICTNGGHSLFVLDTSDSDENFAVTCVHITDGGKLTTVQYNFDGSTTNLNGDYTVTRVARPYYSFLNTEKVWISTKTKTGTTNDNGNIDLGLGKAIILLSCYALSADGSTQYTCTPYVSAKYNTWFCNITKVTSQETVANTAVTIVCHYISA